MSTVLSFPRQRLSYKKKIANDNEWGKNMLDNLIQYASDQSHDDYERKLSNYQLYNNKIHQASFERECNPMGIDVGQFKDEVHPYNKTYNKIQVLLGEEIKRPFNYKAVLINGEGIRAKQEQKKAVIRQYITQQIDQVIEELTQQEIIKDSSELVDPAQLQAAMSTNFMEDREILANKILSYYWRRLDCKAKKNDSFKHGLLAGEEVV